MKETSRPPKKKESKRYLQKNVFNVYGGK